MRELLNSEITHSQRSQKRVVFIARLERFKYILQDRSPECIKGNLHETELNFIISRDVVSSILY